MLSMETYAKSCAAKMLSPRGRCATFSDEANGFCPGRGLRGGGAEAVVEGGGRQGRCVGRTPTVVSMVSYLLRESWAIETTVNLEKNATHVYVF